MAATGVELASGFISLSADTSKMAKQIKSALRDVEKAADRAGANMGRSMSNSMSQGARGGASRLGVAIAPGMKKAGARAGMAFMAAFKASVAAAGVAAIAAPIMALSKGFSRLKTIDDAKFRLAAFGKTTKEINSILADVTASVKGTPIALDKALGRIPQLLQAGVKPGKQLRETVTALADATAMNPGGDFEGLALVFTQVLNKQKLAGEEMLQLSERGVPIQKMLQKELGVTADELEKMGRKGEITFDHMLSAMKNSQITGLAKRMGNTVGGAFDNMQAAIARVGEAMLKPLFGNAPGEASYLAMALNRVGDSLDGLSSWMDSNKEAVVGFFATMADVALAATQDVVKSFGDMAGFIGETIAALGNTLGWFDKYINAPFNDLIGQDDKAEEIRQRAEDFYGWGESLIALRDSAYETADGIDETRGALRSWESDAKAAARQTRDMKDALEALGNMRAPTWLHQGGGLGAVAGGGGGAGGPRSGAGPVLNDFLGQVGGRTGGTAAGGTLADLLIGGGASGGGAGGFGGIGPGGRPTPGSGLPGQISGVLGDGPIAKLPVTPDGGDTGGAILPQTQALWDRINERFPGVASPGDHAYRKPDGYNEHSSGKALDLMIPNYNTPEGRALGDAIMQYAFQDPNVQRIMWQHQTFSPDGSSNWVEERGNDTQNHMDHLHIKMFNNGGAVSGSGNEDTVPAWLTPGEHVLNRADVRAMGGQSGVAAFRNALHFNDGGPVVPFGPWGGIGDSQDFTPWLNEPTAEDIERAQERAAQEAITGLIERGLGGGVRAGTAVSPHAGAAFNEREQYDLRKLDFGEGYQAGREATNPAQAAFNELIRTQGFVPAMAGNTGVAGTSSLASLWNMGSDVVGGLIDTGASAAKMAVSAAITAAAAGGSFGAGAAAAPAASAAAAYGIDLAAAMGKRTASYWFQMGAILSDALVEQISPFGIPRFLGYDYTQLAPQLGIQQALLTTGERAVGAAIESAMGNRQGAVGIIQGADAGSNAVGAAGQPGPAPGSNPFDAVQGGAPQGAQAPQGPAPLTFPGAPQDAPSDLGNLFGIYDQGGILEPGTAALNLSKSPEVVLTGSQWDAVQASASSGGGRGSVYNVYATNTDDAVRELRKHERRRSLRYSAKGGLGR